MENRLATAAYIEDKLRHNSVHKLHTPQVLHWPRWVELLDEKDVEAVSQKANTVSWTMLIQIIPFGSNIPHVH